MKFIHLICISPIPLSSPCTLISISLDVYCYYFNPIVTLSSYYLPPLFCRFIKLSLLSPPISFTHVIFLTSLPCRGITCIVTLTLVVLISFLSVIPLHYTCFVLISTMSSMLATILYALTNPFFCIRVKLHTKMHKNVTPTPTHHFSYTSSPPPHLLFLLLLLYVPHPLPLSFLTYFQLYLCM